MLDHAEKKPDVPQETPHADQDVGGGSQVDDINIPLVAVSVVFFACLLAVTIISLQAWFMHAQRAEIAAQTIAQEDPVDYSVLSGDKDAQGKPVVMQTELGKTLRLQRTQLHVVPADRKWITAVEPATTSGPHTASASAPARKLWVSIDTAMEQVSKDYQGAKP